MRKIIRQISLFMIVIMSISVTAYSSPVKYGEEYSNYTEKSHTKIFSDVPKSYWAFEYISEMVDRGVLSGYPNGRFYPNDKVTRAEFSKIMTLSAGLPLSYGSIYADVSDSDWFAPYVNTARYYLSGYTINNQTYYLPNSIALREDIAVALVKLKGYNTSGYDLMTIQRMFTDWESISVDARKYVATAVEKGLISGYDDDTFRGQAGITRAEVATLLWRAYQYGNGNKEFDQSNLTKEEIVDSDPLEDGRYCPTDDNFDDEYVDDVEDIITMPSKKDYGWKITTVKNNVNEPRDFSITATMNDGVAYVSGNSVYLLSDNGKEREIFNLNSINIPTEHDLSKRDEIGYTLGLYGYNPYDKCHYVTFTQSYFISNTNYKYVYLYNITHDEFVCMIDPNFGGTWSYIDNEPIQFYSNGDFYMYDCRISANGKTIEKNIGKYSHSIIYNDKSYFVSYDRFENIDCDKFINDAKYLNGSILPSMMKYEHGIICGSNGNIYGYDEYMNEITKLNINGNAGFLLAFDDIENIENKPFDLEQVILNGTITDSENALYFYDPSYNSIRKIERY